jgi:protein-S-isoprenylcysteine O-methyltransferase Ste14
MAQPLLLQNWAAAWAGLFGAGIVCLLRLPREEAMVAAHFGETYIQYQHLTGAIFPGWRKHN